MRVQILFFGQLKDVVGTSAEDVEFDAGASIGTVLERYTSQYPRLKEMADSIAVARNHEFSERDAPLEDGDEVALMPPVSGGSISEWVICTTDDSGFYAVTDDPIDVRDLVERIQRDEHGAVITFEGVVRNHSENRKTLFLEYEGYAPLAVKTMKKIANDVVGKHEIGGIGIVHRVGRLEIGETSVAIVVGSPHRQAAYEASLEAINRLKKLAPIWKKEHFEDGEVWVEGSWEDGVPRPGVDA